MNFNHIYNRFTEFRNKNLPPKSVQKANELVKHMKKPVFSNKPPVFKALLLLKHCKDINKETKNHPKNQNVALNIIAAHLNTLTDRDTILEHLEHLDKEQIPIIEELKKN